MKTKFELGDCVYSIATSGKLIKKEVACSMCDGEKFFYTEQSKKLFICTRCNGSGKRTLDVYREWTVLNKWKITSIVLEYDVITYSDDRGYNDASLFYKEQDLFSTEKEAQEECDRRNKNEA